MVTSTQLNILTADLNETFAGKATTAGSYPVATGPNALAERFLGANEQSGSDTTTSSSFTNLSPIGPTVTSTTGSKALAFITCQMSNNTVGERTNAGLDVTGATTIGSSANVCLRQTSSTANALVMATYAAVFSLTAGSNVFKMEYAVTGGTGTFSLRRLIIQPY